jgi:IclR family transcriptional regulator, KDG regulon repressor
MELATPPVRADRRYIVPAVERAILILQLLGREPGGLTISEIAQKLSIPKSTVFTILTTLQEHHMVEREEGSGRFGLGMELFTLGSIVLESLNPRSAGREILKQLAEETHLTAHLGIIDRDEVVYIEKIESQARIKVSSRVGGRMGLHCTALGKAMLSAMPEAERHRLLQGMHFSRQTPNTIVSLPGLLEELQRVRERGYAVDDEENEPGIRCLAAPVYNHHGEVSYAISISGPLDQITPEKVDELAREVARAAGELSWRLGYRNGEAATLAS